MEQEESIIEYFLGGLPNEQAERVEMECFANEAFAESVFVAEEDLIDRYVRDDLTASERQRFEEFYLTTQARRERLEFAQALKNGLSRTPSFASRKPGFRIGPSVPGFFAIFRKRSAVLGYALGAILLVAAAVGLWRLLRYYHDQRLLARSTNEAVNKKSIATPQTTPSQSPPPARSLTPSPAPSAAPSRGSAPTPQPVFATAVFTLHAGTLRDPNAGEQVLRLSPQTKTVELRFMLRDKESGTYRVEVQTAEGETILVRPSVRAISLNEQSVLTVRASASRFSRHDYIGRIFDARGEPRASYIFRFAR